MKHIFLFIAVVILFNCKPEKEEPKPLTAPVLTTMEAGDITAISALSGGAISSDGGSPVTARGIVWGVSHNPTLADSVSEEGTGIGSFTSDLTPLKYSTTYYVRAYATNSIGTTYGNEVTFNTKAAVPSDGLVGWWPFNGNANDESGNGNDGVVEGAILSADRFLAKNSAFTYDGNGDYIEVVNSQPLVLSNSFSLSTWINLTALNTFNAFISHSSNNQPEVSGYVFGYSAFSNPPSISFQAFPFFDSSTLSSTSGNLIFNNWYSVICTYDKTTGTLKYFFNGNLTDSQVVSYSIIDAGLNLFFGNHFTNNDPLNSPPTNGGLIGKLDDIAIYNRALTAEEIQKIYNGTGF